MRNPSKEPKYLKATVDAIFQLQREKIYRTICVKNIYIYMLCFRNKYKPYFPYFH